LATDATGTPTAKGIRKYNPDADAPSGVGFNGAMDDIDALLDKAQYSTDTKGTNKVAVWNGSAWVYSQVSTAMVADAPAARRFLASDDSNHPAWAAGGWHVIQDTLLSVDTASIDITSIPATFKHLRLEFQARGNFVGNSQDYATIQINGITSNYYSQTAWGAGATPSASESLGAAAGRLGLIVNNGAAAGLNSPGWVLFPNYASGTFNKTWTGSGFSPSNTGTGTLYTWTNSVLTGVTAAINRINIFPPTSGSWLAGSRFTLYGIG
jgi:hypothetical protein